jgi:hypothetical protein
MKTHLLFFLAAFFLFSCSGSEEKKGPESYITISFNGEEYKLTKGITDVLPSANGTASACLIEDSSSFFTSMIATDAPAPYQDYSGRICIDLATAAIDIGTSGSGGYNNADEVNFLLNGTWYQSYGHSASFTITKYEDERGFIEGTYTATLSTGSVGAQTYDVTGTYSLKRLPNTLP